MDRASRWVTLHALFVAVLALGAWVPLPDARLYGKELPAAAPTFSWAGWFGEKVQKDAQRWFEGRIAFRGAMVRTDNYLSSVLGETKPGALVKYGLDSTLFIDEDVAYAARPSRELVPAAALQEIARLAREAQEAALRKGMRLVLVLSPSKTSLYPEAVPPRWRRRTPQSPPPERWVYETFRDALVAEGVAFVDGRGILAATPSEEREVLFTRTGLHWTEVGACRVLRTALPSLDCSFAWTAPDPHEAVDIDLLRLLNTWHPGGVLPRVPTLTPRPPPPTAAPRAVFVGTSFTWLLIDVARQAVRDPVCLYYNRNAYDVSEPRVRRDVGPVDPSLPSWTSLVRERDLVVLELMEGYLHDDYSREFLAALRDRL